MHGLQKLYLDKKQNTQLWGFTHKSFSW